MSGRTAAVLVGILAVLVALVALTTPRADRPGPAAVVRLVDVPASQIGEIEATDGVRAVRIESAAGFGGWMVTESRAESGKAPGKSWPVSEATRSAGLRVLANAEMRVENSKTTEFTKRVNILDLDRNVICTLSMDDLVLAGRVQASVQGGEKGTIERELANFLSLDSLLAWRDPAVLPGLDASVVSVLVERGGEVVALRRVGANWALERPVQEPADGARVQALIDGLVAAKSERFIDELGGEERSEGVWVVVEAGASGDRRRYEMTLDAEGLSAEVALSKVGSGGATEVARGAMQVPVEFVALLDVGVEDLVSRRTVATPASEVAAVTLSWSGREVARTSTGWASAEDQSLGTAWLDLLTSRDADEISLAEPGAEAIGEIALRGFGALAMGAVRVRAGDGVVWLARDRVWRGYRMGWRERQSLGLRE